MLFKLNPAAAEPLYVQLVQQITHAIESGVLQEGDLLPGIRTLAADLVIGHNTVAKAYSQLQADGVIELRQGSGAYVATRIGALALAKRVRRATDQVRAVLEGLKADGFNEEEIERFVKATLYADRTYTVDSK